ncbi:hypothetical protein [Leisingera thetidis]|uniref:hypothetical protein n=1 Tax=Leisingera thetidis TaxID=2930199 RepID=UPI0021F6FAFC|nr:hypothetical protein [Leisingera thetidis]
MHTDEINEQLWNAGTYLSQAYRSFAPADLRKEWETVSKRNSILEAKLKVDELLERKAKFSEAAPELIAAIRAVDGPKERLVAEMKNALVRSLIQEAVSAIGFEHPRHMTSKPVRLPAQFWQGQINWQENELKSQGLHFVEIRIVGNDTVKTLSASIPAASHPPTAPKPPIKGRPSVQPQIKRAYLRTLASGVLTPHMSVKTVTENVRVRLAEDFPDLGVTAETPNYETFRRIVSPLWKEDKKQ